MSKDGKAVAVAAIAVGVAYCIYSSYAAAAKKKASIYERIGGAPAVQAVIDIAIPSLRKDAELAPFFTKMPEAYHKKMQFKFFTTALGGPKLYDGKSMKAAHKGKGITERHFFLVCDYVVKAMEELNVPADLQKEVGDCLAPLVDDCTG